MADIGGLEQEYNKHSNDRSGAINDMYDAQKESQLTQMENAYNQSKSNAEAARDKLPGQYQQQANDLAVQYERNRRNLNQQVAGSGLNTGTASQAALAQNSGYQRDFGKVRTAQADAIAEADRGLVNLESQYQSGISAAIAQNDYQKAAALLDEYNNQYNRNLSQAQTLASYGDFSMYAQIYGQEQADKMAATWKAQNPNLAYNTGNISANEYYSMTGKYPAGYTPPAAASGGGYYGGGSYNYGNASGLSSSEIKAIQNALGVPADGIWGSQTENAYNAAIAKTPPAGDAQSQAERYYSNPNRAASHK